MRTLPDGTFQATNIRIRQVMNAASPEPVTDITGLPDWVLTERYDIIGKPAPDSHPTREQRAEMMRNMLIERMKVAGHIEQVERPGFALVVARSDGRLGPQLKRSTLDCFGADRARCGGRVGLGVIESNAVLLDQFALEISGLAGGVVNNRTGLEGRYDLTLHFAVSMLSADPTALVDDAPQFVTALQEQLGLKLVPEKTKVKIFVVDHIERPAPN
jgi:bla regulator protein BlaR1